MSPLSYVDKQASQASPGERAMTHGARVEHAGANRPVADRRLFQLHMGFVESMSSALRESGKLSYGVRMYLNKISYIGRIAKRAWRFLGQEWMLTPYCPVLSVREHVSLHPEPFRCTPFFRLVRYQPLVSDGVFFFFSFLFSLRLCAVSSRRRTPGILAAKWSSSLL